MRYFFIMLLSLSASSLWAKSSMEPVVHCKQAQIISQGDEVILLAGLAHVVEVKAALKKTEDFKLSGLVMEHLNKNTPGGFDRYYRNVTLERKGSLVVAKKQIETTSPIEFAELTLEDPGTLAPTLSVGNADSSYGVQLVCTFLE